MGHGIFGWDLPPGCRVSDIPGNRPEDAEWESIVENFFDKKRFKKQGYGLIVSGKEHRAISAVYRAKKYQKIADAVETYIEAAIEYGIELGNKQADNRHAENKEYDKLESEHRMDDKTHPYEALHGEFIVKNDWSELENALNAELPIYWNDADAQVAHETPCPKCGNPMCYMGFWDKERKHFKHAFAVCHNDNFAIMF